MDWRIRFVHHMSLLLFSLATIQYTPEYYLCIVHRQKWLYNHTSMQKERFQRLHYRIHRELFHAMGGHRAHHLHRWPQRSPVCRIARPEDGNGGDAKHRRQMGNARIIADVTFAL